MTTPKTDLNHLRMTVRELEKKAPPAPWEKASGTNVFYIRSSDGRYVCKTITDDEWDYETIELILALRNSVTALLDASEQREAELRRVVEEEIQSLDSLADLLADSEDVLVKETPAVETLNKVQSRLTAILKGEQKQ